MHLFRRACRMFRCRSLQECFVLVVFSTLLMCYFSFRFSRNWKQLANRGSWQQSESLAQALKRSILAQKLQSQEKWSPTSRTQQTYNFSLQLRKLLVQIEEQVTETYKNAQRIAQVRGQPRVIFRDLPTYRKVLEKHGFQVVLPLEERNFMPSSNTSGHFRRRNPLEPFRGINEAKGRSNYEKKNSNWRIMLCLTFSDVSCLPKEEQDELKEYQKVNRFPGLRSVLWKRDAFCSTMTMAKQLPAMRNEQVSPLCFVLPSQLRQLSHVVKALGYTAKWTVKPISPAAARGGFRKMVDTSPKIFDFFTQTGMRELQGFGNQGIIVQQLQDNPLTIFGQPFSIRVYLLITSLAPLKAFVHSEGVVHHRYGPNKNFNKIAGRTWLLSELWQYISKNHGSQSVTTAMTNLYHVLLQMLLIVEAAILSTIASKNDFDVCRHCFQLLGVDLIFNSTFHPIVLEVNGQPTLKESSRPEAEKFNHMRKSLVEDLINILFPKTSQRGTVAAEVADGLLESSTEIGVLDWSCSISSDMCLSRADLQYLVKSRMENLNQGGFRQLYPSADAGVHDALVEQLQKHFTELFTARTWLQHRRHSTSDLHRLLVSLERWYGRTVSDEYYNDVDVHVEASRSWKSGNNSTRHQATSFKAYDESMMHHRMCSEDPSTMPLLSSISIHPALLLSPPFSPLVMEYYINVSYDVTLIQVSAVAENCQTEARMEDRFGLTRTMNMSLGVGENQLNIMVVDIVHAEPWVINSYSLSITRLPVTHGELPFLPSMEHQICSLKQECDMQTFFNEPCGLYRDQRHRDLTWEHYMKSYALLPLCKSGDAQGRWILPCKSCGDPRTCFWKESTWHPFFCQYGQLKQLPFQKCLQGKKLLFIGDSTNRGIMHYLIEKLNGTLTEWDKTHDIRVYENINGGNTTVSFSYYPQFWLPTNQRPVFEKAVYHLIQRSRPLQNNSNTILIVGGVHWLAIQHLHMLLRAIRVERLHGIKLVMKTLGAGFHQPVESVHTLSMEEQQKLILHNRGLADFARHYNFEVIDTFNITIARYKDFMQGKCSCHFHKVVEVPQNAQQQETPNLEDYRTKSKTKYHVEGTINAIYSEILFSRLCSDYVDVR